MALVTGYGTYVVNKNRKEMKSEKGECKCKKGECGCGGKGEGCDGENGECKKGEGCGCGKKGEGCGCGKKEGCKSHCGKKQSQTECLVGVME